MNEVWKSVSGYERYKVSSLGRVLGPKKMLKPSPNRSGYLRIKLCGKPREFTPFIHRLVMRAFVGERPNGYEINHINNIRADNRLSNLEYCTPEQNESYKEIHGTRARCHKHGSSKFKTYEVLWIRKHYKKWSKTHGLLPLSKKFNMSISAVHSVVKNKYWQFEKLGPIAEWRKS